jgi:hypothetical protein
MLDQFLATAIMEAGREPFAQSNDLVRLPQQKRSSVRCDRPAIKTSHNFAAADRCESKQVRVTLCRHRGGSSDQSKVVLAKQLSLIRRPDALS